MQNLIKLGSKNLDKDFFNFKSDFNAVHSQKTKESQEAIFETSKTIFTNSYKIME